MHQIKNRDKNKTISLVFPHQLFEQNPCIASERPIWLIEEFLFFKQYKFHQQKIAFHRATMNFYEKYLLENGYKVIYIDSFNPLSDVRNLMPYLAKEKIEKIYVCDVTDYWLEQRINKLCKSFNIFFS